LEKTPIVYDEQTIAIKASFGVTGIDSGTDVTPEMLYRKGDQEAYHAKALGGSSVCVNLTPIQTNEAGN